MAPEGPELVEVVGLAGRQGGCRAVCDAGRGEEKTEGGEGVISCLLRGRLSGRIVGVNIYDCVPVALRNL